MNDTPSSSATSSAWRLDEDYGFQLAFFREVLPSSSAEGFVAVPPHSLVPANEPDIKNIVLSGFLNRGFLPKVRAQSENQCFYLKLFKFPKNIISPQESYEKILKNFFLTKMRRSQVFQSYIAETNNILVKFGWIAPASNDFASQPFPDFLIPENPEDAQEYFDSSLPFSSLYVSPPENANPGLSEEHLIEHSRNSVSAFHQELLDIYRSAFRKIVTDDHRQHVCC